MLKNLRDFDVRNKRVLVRCDFNVPLDEQGNVLDDFRIRAALPTIQYLIKNKAKIILMSHLGEPEGQIVENLKMDKVQIRLVKLLGVDVTKAQDCVDYMVEKYTYGLNPGDILLLENLRFHKGESDNDPEFARRLARNGEIYINDAFGVCHRNHASVVGVPQYIPSGIGLLVEKELQNLVRLTVNPARPMVALIGGKKVETKAGLINKVSEIADFVLVSGLIKKEIDEKGMAFQHPEKIIGPIDAIEIDGQSPDIGPKTVALFKDKIKKAKTIFWNGPFGKTEEEQFQKGTFALAKAISKRWFCFTAAGGGETVEFLNQKKLFKKFDYVSTGGGAMLSYLSGEELPGLAAINNFNYGKTENKKS